MRFTGTLFALLAVGSQLAWWATTGDDGEAVVGRLRLDPLFAVLFLASLMSAVLWGLLVLVNGGPRRFYDASRAWRREPEQPLPPTAPPVAVQTDRVLRSYRPDVAAYGAYAKGVAPIALALATPTLGYAVFSLSVGGFLSTGLAITAAVAALLVLVMAVYLLCLFRRSRVDIHPNGVTVAGAFRRVVLQNNANTLVIRGGARTGLHAFGASYVDRATGKRCSVWPQVFDVPNSVDAMAFGAIPQAVVREAPSRDLARYVSVLERERWLPAALMLLAIVLIASVAVGISEAGGFGQFVDDLQATPPLGK